MIHLKRLITQVDLVSLRWQIIILETRLFNLRLRRPIAIIVLIPIIFIARLNVVRITIIGSHRNIRWLIPSMVARWQHRLGIRDSMCRALHAPMIRLSILIVTCWVRRHLRDPGFLDRRNRGQWR
jgi:hypothetical protein